MNDSAAPRTSPRVKSAIGLIAKALVIIAIILIILFLTRPQSSSQNGNGNDNSSGNPATGIQNFLDSLIPDYSIIREVITPDIRFNNQTTLVCTDVTTPTISISASNGLNALNNDIRLGGTLNVDTTITQDGKSLTISGGNFNAIGGDSSEISAGNTSISASSILDLSGSSLVLNGGTISASTSGSQSYSSSGGNISFGIGNNRNISLDGYFNLVKNGSGVKGTQINGVTYYWPVADGTSNYVLSTDGAGSLNWVAQGSGGVTASNGLNASGIDVRLGGTLNTPTTIIQANNALTFSGGNFSVASSGAGQSISLTANDAVSLVASTGDVNITSGDEIISTAPSHIFNGNSFVTGLAGNALIEANGDITLDAGNTVYLAGGVRVDINTYIQVGTTSTTISGVEYFWPNADGSTGYVLSTDGSGNLAWIAQSGGGGTVTASNGLNAVGDDVRLGGSLNTNTIVDINLNSLTFSNGDFYVAAAIGEVDISGSYLSLVSTGDVDIVSNQRLSLQTTGYELNISATGIGADAFITADNDIQLTAGNTVDINGYLQVDTTSTTINGVQYYWPVADGTNNYQLTTDGSGNLTWEAAGGGGGGIGDANNGIYLYDGTTFRLGVNPLIENTTINQNDGVGNIWDLNITNGSVFFGSATTIPTNDGTNERDTITVSQGGITLLEPTRFFRSDDIYRNDGSGGFQVTYSNNYGFVLQKNWNRISVLDVTNRSNIIEVDYIDIPNPDYRFVSFKVDDETLFASARKQDNGIGVDVLYIFDITDKNNEVLQNTIPLFTTSDQTIDAWQYFAKMQISGDMLFIPVYATGSSVNSIEVWNITSPDQPRFCNFVGPTDMSGAGAQLGDMKVLGERVYWTTRGTLSGVVGVSVFPDCGAVQETTEFGTDDRSYVGIEVVGKYIFAAREGTNMGVDVFEVVDTNDIVYLTTVAVGCTPSHLQASGRYLFVASSEGFCGLMTIDISNPLSPVYLGEVYDITVAQNAWDTVDIEIVGNYMYAAAGHHGFRIYDMRGIKTHALSSGSIDSDYLYVLNRFEASNDGHFGGNLKVSRDISVSGEARLNTRLVTGNCTTSSLGIVVCDSFGSMRSHINSISGGNSFMLDNLTIGGLTPVDNARVTAQHTTGLPLAVSRGNNGTLVEFYIGATSQGSITVSSGTVSYNAFTGSHYAYIDPIDGLPVQPDLGKIMTLTGVNKNLNNDSSTEILYGVEESTIENDPKILGSYLSLQNPSVAHTEKNPHLIMANGNGVMWVEEADSTNLTIGDYLISSKVKGFAKRDPRTASMSYVIAKVAEDINWSTITETVDYEGTLHKRVLVSVLFEPFARDNGVVSALTAAGWLVNGIDKIQTGYQVIAPKATITIGEFTLLSTKSFTVSDGAFAINQDGDLTTLGSITAPRSSIQEMSTNVIKALNGSIVVQLAEGESFNVRNSSNDVIFGASSNGSLRAEKAAGLGTIASGQTEVIVTNTTVTTNSRIIVTANSSVQVYVKQKNNGNFVVAISGTQGTDTTFDYLIIN